jgi:hypothetical protein
MKPRQEFLILETDGGVAVYSPRTFPIGTPIGRDARRLGVNGPSLVRPPKVEMSEAEFDAWRQQVEGAGFTVTLGPFWRNPVSLEQAEEAIRRGETMPLKEAFDELLREAERREQEEDRRMEALKSRHP